VVTDDWLLQALREEQDRAVIGEYVQARVGRPSPQSHPRPADELNPHRPLREAS
jgi:hypothetical protein